MSLTSSQIRERFLKFFEKRGHVIIPSASLIPENDPTTLFTGSGMQPMLPYLLGQKHPQGTRIADSQKSFRAEDIEEVGDNRHTTFFEMLGNWSFGDYFRKEQLQWISEFLFDELKIDPNKLYVTVFGGDTENNLSKDTESVEIWKQIFKTRKIEANAIELGSEADASNIGMQGGRIFYYGSKNWWSRSGSPSKMPVGEPGGPDSEMFYEFDELIHDKKFGEHCHPNCDCGRYIEIGNNVFMTYRKVAQGIFEPLPSKNIDFGGGLERIVMAANATPDTFVLNYKEIIRDLEKNSGIRYGENNEKTKAFRIIADHIKACVFLISDGVFPSNTDRGYFVRRLLRRSIRYADMLGIKKSGLADMADSVLRIYEDIYPEIYEKLSDIKKTIRTEEEKFRKTLSQGMREFENGTDPFVLFSTYGFPIELTMELAKENGVEINRSDFDEKFKKHQELSRTGSEQKFKGGLSGSGVMETKYHTTAHLLHQALRDVINPNLLCKGSNITPERLRFDFPHDKKLTEEEKKKIEDIVNQKISENLPVKMIVMKKEEALKTGALHVFDQRYPNEVNVYYIGDSLENAYSKEFCGGPHVDNTGILGKFKIIKEESVSSSVRRIKAVLE